MAKLVKHGLAKVVLGIDPGTVRSGYGVLRGRGSELECLALGHKDLRKCVDDAHKLAVLADWVAELIQSYKVEELAIECPFLGRNARSFMKLARAQGVVMAAASRLGCRVFEYAPATVKSASVGHGLSSKQAVWRSLELRLKIKLDQAQYQDASDALAVAMTHLARRDWGLDTRSRRRKNSRALWKNYVQQLGLSCDSAR